MNDMADFSADSIGSAVNSLYGTKPASGVSSADDFNSNEIHAAVMDITSPKSSIVKPKWPSESDIKGMVDTKPLVTGTLEAGANAISGIGSGIIGGYRGIYEVMRGLANGQSFSDAVNSANDSGVIQGEDKGSIAQAYQPSTPAGEKLVQALTLPAAGIDWAGRKVGNVSQDMGASPGVATLANVGTQAALTAATFGLGKGKSAPNNELPPQYRKPVASANPALVSESVPETIPTKIPAGAVPVEKVSSVQPKPVDLNISIPEAGTKAAAIESPPVKGGLPLPVQSDRAAVLQRVGLDSTWKHAITGDAMDGATNAQLARFDEPAGIAAKAQFAKEYDALTNHAAGIIKDTGGTIGLDEDALHARGQSIAAPFDALSGWFDKSTQGLYKEADTRSQGLPVVQTEVIDNLLADRAFNNSAMAQDRGNLVNAIKNQLDLFKENNPQGLTVADSESFRKWLNQQWSPENKYIIGKVTNAVDDAVMQSAGEDVYGKARAMSQLKKQTLENPKGLNRIMETDPNTPINRTTAFEKIPDTVTRLGVDQYKNVMETLDKMPEDIQPLAQAAKAEIKAHFANKLLKAGQPNTKTPSVFWNNRKVNDFLSSNKAKIASSFSPEEIQKISDLRAAGNILSVDASYPGAAAQAANVAKQGLMSRIIPSITTSLGAGGGSLFGPGGAAAGGWAGRAVGEKMAVSSAEKSALNKVNKRMVPLSEVGK